MSLSGRVLGFYQFFGTGKQLTFLEWPSLLSCLKLLERKLTYPSILGPPNKGRPHIFEHGWLVLFLCVFQWQGNKGFLVTCSVASNSLSRCKSLHFLSTSAALIDLPMIEVVPLQGWECIQADFEVIVWTKQNKKDKSVLSQQLQSKMLDENILEYEVQSVLSNI